MRTTPERPIPIIQLSPTRLLSRYLEIVGVKIQDEAPISKKKKKILATWEHFLEVSSCCCLLDRVTYPFTTVAPAPNSTNLRDPALCPLPQAPLFKPESCCCSDNRWQLLRLLPMLEVLGFTPRVPTTCWALSSSAQGSADREGSSKS